MGVNLLSFGQSFVELLPSSVSAYFINQSLKAICPQGEMTGFFINANSDQHFVPTISHNFPQFPKQSRDESEEIVMKLVGV